MPRSSPRRTTALGDSALRIECADSAVALAAALAAAAPTGVTDIVPAYGVVVVHFDPLHAGQEAVAEWAAGVRLGKASKQKPAEVEVPVLYQGEDLAEVARHCGLSAEEVIERHAGAAYRVRAVGFLPGFPYLDGLPPELATPRRATPRTRVPAGAVGIGGAQTGVYPLASPGGWNLIGQTPIELFDPDREPPALLRPGDMVRFRPIDGERYEKLLQAEETMAAEGNDRALSVAAMKVLDGGAQTTVQDLGRPGLQSIGVTPGGAMDPVAARLANLLVGNRENAPLLEAVLRGPKLRAQCDVTAAVVGGHGEATGRPFSLAKGDTLDARQIAPGARAYVAVAGGVGVPRRLGGRGANLRAGLSGMLGRALVKGDRLGLLATTPPPSAAGHHWFVRPETLTPADPEGKLRVLRGPQADWFSEEAWRRLLGEAFDVAPQSDRMGVRLAGPTLATKQTADMMSEPVVAGAIQTPPSGDPIVLAADRQTIGGYPVIACLATADLPRLGQLRPGDQVRFREIDRAEALALLKEREKNFAVLRRGLELRG
ncbi:KipI antagonist [Pseudobythopirellula maris]|uniref:KipI antagonist n=1 Tax=Pseudobythopirellula maris TaxID=2527991 RepID=A0A5C5ZND6_9BACT|nr:5-oxoprolinase subunit PxpB [Pseudobythopirellula maris]TWT88575.1 KipI antagonist [Pseudobythopirellula maris]